MQKGNKWSNNVEIQLKPVFLQVYPSDPKHGGLIKHFVWSRVSSDALILVPIACVENLLCKKVFYFDNFR